LIGVDRLDFCSGSNPESMRLATEEEFFGEGFSIEKFNRKESDQKILKETPTANQNNFKSTAISNDF
jgi:hypothetical protein